MKYLNQWALGAVAIAALSFVPASPTPALEIDLGGSEIDLDDDDSDIRPRVSTDGDQLDVEVYEDPDPETRIDIGDDGVTIEQEERRDRELIELSVPVD